MLTQVMELDADKSGHSYRQVMNLTEGKYKLKMDYAPNYSQPPQESSFTIFFNGVEIANIRPDLYGVTTLLLTVLGRNGPNVLEFVDRGTVDNYGAAVDNVGIFAWKTNKLCIKEIMAVEAGYPVTPISVYTLKHNNYRLDSGEPGQTYAWCPIRYSSPNQWIKVSSI